MIHQATLSLSAPPRAVQGPTGWRPSPTVGTVPSWSRTRPGPRSSPFPGAQQEALMGLEPPPGRLGSGCIGRQSRQVNCQSSHLPGLWIHLQPTQAAIPVPAPAPLVHWCPPPSSAADHYLAEASAAPGRVRSSTMGRTLQGGLPLGSRSSGAGSPNRPPMTRISSGVPAEV